MTATADGLGGTVRGTSGRPVLRRDFSFTLLVRISWLWVFTSPVRKPMPFARIRLQAIVALFAITAAPCGITTAQVPVGSAVVGTASGPNSTGTAGLFLVTLPGGVVTPITGLPSYLTSTGPTTTEQGIATVDYRSSDGAIVVGTVAAAGGPASGKVELFLFYLNGSTVDPARTRQLILGTTTTTAGAWVTVMPDDRILVTAGPIASGPMAASPCAIVEVDSSMPAPILSPLPAPAVPFNGLGGGQAVDPTGQYIYLAATANPGQATMVASLYRVELATNQACTIASWPGELVQGLFCDDDGGVYVSSSSLAPAAHFVHRVMPDGCTSTSTTTADTVSIAPSGVTLDRASGRFLVPSAAFAPGFPPANRNALWLVDPASGSANLVAGGPGVWGSMGRSLAVNNAIDSYGARSDGANHHWFANFPNPGGQPLVGSPGFTLTLASDPASPQPLLSVLGFSSGRGLVSTLGIEVLLELGGLSALTLASGPSVTFPLPIPNTPNLQGVALNAQSVHLESSGAFAASHGLALTLQ